MRILHLIDHLGLGGAQTALADLVADWPASEDQLHVVGMGRPIDLQSRFPSDSLRRVESFGSRRWEWSSLRRVEELLHDRRYDIVHTHLCKSVITGLWARRPSSTRLVIHLHGDPRHDFPILRWTLRWGWNRADALIAVSQHTADAARRHLRIPDRRMHLIYNAMSGLDTETDSTIEESKAVRHGLGIDSNELLLGFVGRLITIKGLDELLQSFAQVRRRRNDVHLALVGDGPLAAPLREEAEKLGVANVVHFAGSQSDVTNWFRAFDIAIFPSWTEGLPVAVVEAMRSGTPIVASKVGGIPEVIQDGRTGCLIPPKNPDSLTRAILALADDPELRIRLACAARRVAEEHFAAATVGRQVRELYVGILNR